mgnify:CR=1 FL=1
MKLYRFSPIRSEQELIKAIHHTHFACHELTKHIFGKYFPNAGNIGIFCHYDDEYEYLTKVREELTDAEDNINQKYFKLHEPITSAARSDIPKTVYTDLYIRKPDPYRHHVGDVDFYLKVDEYKELKRSLLDGKIIKGARIFDRKDLDMIELYDPDIDACAYFVPERMI